MNRQLSTLAFSLKARAAIAVTQLTKISGLSLTILLALANSTFARPIADFQSAEFDLAYACLLKEMDAKEPGEADIQTQVTDIQSQKIDACISVFSDPYRDESKVTVNFENMAFSDQVKMAGSFAFSPSAVEDGVVDGAELVSFHADISPGQSNFLLSEDIDFAESNCHLSSMKNFSYEPSENYDSLIKLRAFLKVARDIANQRQDDVSIKSLVTKLDALEAQLLVIDESPSQLEFGCKSQASEIAVAGGLADIAVVHNRTSASPKLTSSSYEIPGDYRLPSYSSASSGISFRFSNRTVALTTNDGTLRMALNRKNDRVETSYQQLPFVLDIEELE